MKAKNNITIEEIIHLSKLANLSITQEEAKKYATQLGAVLDYVRELNEIDTDDVEPTAHISGSKNITFEDVTPQAISIDKTTLKLKKVGNKDYFSITK